MSEQTKNEKPGGTPGPLTPGPLTPDPPAISLPQLNDRVESCDGCGACCMEQESPPMYIGYLTGTFTFDDHPDARRVAALPVELKRELLEYVDRLRRGRGHPNNDVCLWLDEDTRRCRHYDLRPEICREGVKVDDEVCRAWRREYPPKGIDHGK